MIPPVDFPERNFSMYQIKAAIDWLISCNYRPYVAINTTVPGLDAPTEYASRSGILILDFHGEAVRDFYMDYENSTISFNGRFKGKPVHVHIPVQAVMSVYAKENPDICVDLPGIPLNYPSSIMSASELPEEFKALLNNALDQGKPIILSSLGDLADLGKLDVSMFNKTPETSDTTETPAPDVVFCSAESQRKANVRRAKFTVIDGGKGK